MKISKLGRASWNQHGTDLVTPTFNHVLEPLAAFQLHLRAVFLSDREIIAGSYKLIWNISSILWTLEVSSENTLIAKKPSLYLDTGYTEQTHALRCSTQWLSGASRGIQSKPQLIPRNSYS